MFRNKIILEATRGQIRFCDNVFWNQPSILARYMPWSGQYWWRPLEAKSDFGTMFFGTGQVFWPDICPGQASRGQGCEHQWTFLLRNKIFLEAIRGQINFFSCESNSKITNVCSSVCLSVLITPFNLNPSSFNLHPSSYSFHHSSFNLHPSFRDFSAFQLVMNRPSLLARKMPWSSQ